MSKYLIKQTVKVGGRIVKPDPEGVELSEAEAKAAAAYIQGKAEGASEPVKGSKGSGGKSKGGKSAGDSSAAGGQGGDPDPQGSGESSKEPSNSDTPPGGDDSSSKAAAVNVNTASAAEIAKAAHGIGAATAKDLVKHRKANPFKSLDELVRVGGISKHIVDDNRDVLTV